MNYLLRNIDPVLWKKVKVFAAKEGMTLKELIIKGLKIILAGGGRTYDKEGKRKSS